MEDSLIKMQSDGLETAVEKEHVILLIGTLLLGFIFNFLFYGNQFGISYPVFVIAFYVLLFYCMRKSIYFKPDMAWALSIPVFMLSLTYFLHSNFIFDILDFMAIPLLIIAQTVLITQNNTYRWHSPGFLIDILYGLFYRTIAYMSRPFKVIAGFFPKKTGKSNNPVLHKVLLGILVSVPLVIIVVSLLVSADQIFESYVNRIPAIFAGIKIEEYLGRGFFILFVFFLSFSYLSSLSERKKPGPVIPGDGSLALPKVWDPVVVLTVLAIVNVIYLLFVFIQFAYLFCGADYNLPAHFTFSEYARGGFFELVVVTLINFGILSVCLGFTKTGGRVVVNTIRILYSLLVGCTVVMLLSAYYRMLLYEEAYGFTYLRVLTQSFMVFLLVLFVIMLLKIWNDRILLAKPYIIASLAAFVIVNYMNIDAVIAGNNVDRYYLTGKVDTGYLAALSYDAVPEIAKLAGCGDEKLAGQVRKILQDKKKELGRNDAWQSFNISKYTAQKILKNY